MPSDEEIEQAIAENGGDKEAALADLTADAVLNEGMATEDGPVTASD